MADRTVNGVKVYQDSAGFWRESPIDAGGASTSPAITSTYSLASAADGLNAAVVSTSPVSLASIDAYNARTGGVRVLLYDKATLPVVGTDTPKWTLYLPPVASTGRDYPAGIRFSTGLAVALAPDDAAGLMAGDVQGLNLGYSA